MSTKAAAEGGNSRKLRYGMIGGGPPRWIGKAHRHAADLTRGLELVAGVFSSREELSRAFARSLGIDTERAYATYQEMAQAEQRRRQSNERDALDFVVVVTPNPLHFDVSRTFLEAGFPVLSDKPLTETLADAEKLVELVQQTRLPFGLTHNYTGYAMVKEGRELIRTGKLGQLRKVMVSYEQGRLPKQGVNSANPPRLSSLVDVGTHAEHLMRYISVEASAALNKRNREWKRLQYFGE
jgi:predicted dehydrogenase